MAEKITHALPLLGRIEVPLHAESAAIFSLFERFSNAAVSHLQQQDHLGELRGILKCGHHSRYEYLILQLYFIHFLKHNAKTFGLSASVTIPSGAQVSSCEELLKCWAFIEELGHLRGTYEAERFLLKALCHERSTGDLFVSCFSDDRAKAFARSVLDNEDLWNLHRCISWLTLEFYRDQKLKSARSEIDNAIELLFALVAPENQNVGLARARGYFQRVRRLAHIYLDTANLPTHIHFHPAILLQKIQDDPTSFVGEGDQVGNRLFGALLDYLQNDIYSSVAANTYKLERCDGLLEKYNSKIKKPSPPTASKAKFTNWILSAKGTQFWGYAKPLLPREHQLRIRLISDGYFDPTKLKLCTEERNFERQVRDSRWSLFLTGYDGPTGKSTLLDVYLRPASGRAPEGRVITALIELVKRSFPELAKWNELLTAFCDDQFAEIVRFILRRVFPGPYRFRFAIEGRLSEHSTVLLQSRKTRTDWSRKAAWDLKRSKLSTERKWEIECLKREVRKAPNGFIICVTTPVFVEDVTNNSSIAEFDGVFLRVHGSKAELNIIEAKTTHTGAHRAAVSELKAKMIRLGISKSTVDHGVSKLEKSAIIRL